jgi:hypothetical protein
MPEKQELAKTDNYITAKEVVFSSVTDKGFMVGTAIGLISIPFIWWWSGSIFVALLIYLLWHGFREWKEKNELIDARFLEFVKEAWYGRPTLDFIPDELEPELKMPRYLVPANQPNPVLKVAPNIPPEAMAIYFGNCVGWTSGEELGLIEIKGDSILTAKQTNRGLLINLKLYDKRGGIIATIVENRFLGQMSGDLEIQTSESSVDIFDKKSAYRHIFHIRYLNPKAMEVLGLFYHPAFKNPIIMDENGVAFPNGLTMSNCSFGQGRYAFVFR